MSFQGMTGQQPMNIEIDAHQTRDTSWPTRFRQGFSEDKLRATLRNLHVFAMYQGSQPDETTILFWQTGVWNYILRVQDPPSFKQDVC